MKIMKIKKLLTLALILVGIPAVVSAKTSFKEATLTNDATSINLASSVTISVEVTYLGKPMEGVMV
ncbi:MAG: hypothetical protein WED10_06635, partial [Brumimicrobium sp.]